MRLEVWMLVLLAVVHGSTEAVIHDLSSTAAESGLSTVTGEPNPPPTTE